MMRACVVILVFVAVTGVSSAAARSPLPVLEGCMGKLLVRPSSIAFCGDGNFYLTNLKWSRWTAANAAAMGQAHQNDCNPYCAAGHFHVYRVVIGLSRPAICSHGRREYTRLY
jgi:hypothetical protein